MEAIDLAAERSMAFHYVPVGAGYRAWNASRQASEVSIEDVERGAKLAQEELEYEFALTTANFAGDP